MGRLIVLDGLDGCGKSTQGERVAGALRARGEKVKLISFPDYAEPSSTLVRMYLGGEFSDDPDGVNAYAAGSFYAVDRYASYLLHWKKDYEAGTTILATRYATSNAIHQMGKLPREEWAGYLQWIEDYEYHKLGIPAPDITVYLEMEQAISDKLLSDRYAGDDSRRDIHEKNRWYMRLCRDTAAFAARYWGWEKVRCDDGAAPLPVEDVTARIVKAIDGGGKLPGKPDRQR